MITRNRATWIRERGWKREPQIFIDNLSIAPTKVFDQVDNVAIARRHDGEPRHKDRLIANLVEGYSLDVGCGRVNHGDVGLDIEDHGEADIVVEEGVEYPFEKDEFDTVICSEVLEHLYEPEFVLREMKRVVKPDGKLIISVPNSGNILYRLGLWDQNTSLGSPHVNFWSRREFAQFLSINGIHVEERHRSWYNKKLYLPFLYTCMVFVGKKSGEQ